MLMIVVIDEGRHLHSQVAGQVGQEVEFRQNSRWIWAIFPLSLFASKQTTGGQHLHLIPVGG